MATITTGASGDSILHLTGGGTLGFREYGVKNGTPLVFFHGWPGSSRQGVFLHEVGQAHGLRVLAVDRPGFGNSSRIPKRSFLDVPPLVEELVQTLHLGPWDVLGVSGGGPYALACAWAFPDRVRAAVVCCGVPPLDSPDARRKFSVIYRGLLALDDRFPAGLQAMLAPASLMARIRPPWPLMRLLALATGPRDRLFLADRACFDKFYPSFLDAMRSGHRSIYDDGHCYARPWPFDVSEIRVPVRFWHGTQDTNFHYTLAERLASRIPGAVFHLRDEGHYSLPAFRTEEIISDLLTCKAAP